MCIHVNQWFTCKTQQYWYFCKSFKILKFFIRLESVSLGPEAPGYLRSRQTRFVNVNHHFQRHKIAYLDKELLKLTRTNEGQILQQCCFHVNIVVENILIFITVVNLVNRWGWWTHQKNNPPTLMVIIFHHVFAGKRTRKWNI